MVLGYMIRLGRLRLIVMRLIVNRGHWTEENKCDKTFTLKQIVNFFTFIFYLGLCARAHAYTNTLTSVMSAVLHVCLGSRVSHVVEFVYIIIIDSYVCV